MKYTENYHLPQWVKTDRIMMDDFNQMCANIEEGLSDNRQRADTAQATAMNRKNYATGSYVATGDVQSISLGFKPSFLIISGQVEVNTSNVDATTSFTRYILFTGGNIITHRVKLTETGFTVYPRNDEYMIYPNGAEAGLTYDYVAFR